MTIHDTLYLTTFHSFIPPIRSVSACKGCCLAPRNNHGSQNPIKSWRTWKLWKVEYGLYLAASELNCQQKNRAWITDDTCKLCKDCIPWNQVFKECIHWLDLDLRWNLTLESLLRPIKESIHRCLKNCWSIYLGVPKSGKMIRIKKPRRQKDPGAWETGTWMLTITNHGFNPAGYLMYLNQS